jgi:hypothetical protein
MHLKLLTGAIWICNSIVDSLQQLLQLIEAFVFIVIKLFRYFYILMWIYASEIYVENNGNFGVK